MIELIVNEANGEKTIALIENGKLTEIYNQIKEDSYNEDSIYVGIVKDIIPGMQSAFIDIGTEKKAFINVKDILPKLDQKKFEKKEYEDKKISEVIKNGDKILVQVKKESYNQKGARISSHINIQSRFIVLMPNTDIITISKKIENEAERNRLLDIAKKLLPQNMGAIIRTSAENKQENDIKLDIDRTINQWNTIEKEFNNYNGKDPKLIFKGPSIKEKIILDMIDRKLENIIVNNDKEFDEMNSIVNKFGFQNIISIKKDAQIIERYDITKNIEDINNRKIWLSSGAFITIEKTEALTAIDVNTGKYVGNNNLEETVYKVNYEATIEIAKQLRLRDIGGIILIDYIDMNKQENKDKIEELLKNEFKNDRAQTQVEGFTKLNLMELTRKHIGCNR